MSDSATHQDDAGDGGAVVSFDRWLAALRSGEYRQGQGALKWIVDGVGEFCCIGVAADLIDPGGWSKAHSERHSRLWRGGGTFAAWEYIPWMTADMARLGLQLNDRDGLSFAEIADRMEAEFPELVGSADG